MYMYMSCRKIHSSEIHVQESKYESMRMNVVKWNERIKTFKHGSMYENMGV